MEPKSIEQIEAIKNNEQMRLPLIPSSPRRALTGRLADRLAGQLAGRLAGWMAAAWRLAERGESSF